MSRVGGATRIRGLASNLHSRLRNLWARLSVGGVAPLAWPAAAMTLSLAFITSVGDTVQLVATGLVVSEAPSIYGTVYQDAIARIPPLSEWLSAGLHLWPILCGLIVATVSIGRGRLSSIMATATVATPLVLTLGDLLGPQPDPLRPANLASNVIGGAAAAALATVSLIAFAVIAGGPRRASSPRLAAAAAATIACGVGTSAIVWAAVLLFLQPVSQNVSVVLKPPVSGYVHALPQPPGSRMAALPTRLRSPTELDLVSAGGRPVVAWRISEGERVRTTASLLVDCPFKSVRDLPTAKPFLRAAVASTVRVELDGPGTMAVDRAEQVGLRAPGPVMYWIDPAKGRRTRITQFLSEEDETSLATDVDAVVAVTVPLMRVVRGHGTVPTARTLAILVDGRRVRLDIDAPTSSTRPRALACRATSPSSTEERSFSASGAIAAATVLIRFTRDAPPRYLGEPSTTLVVRRANGWLSIDGVEPDDLARGDGTRVDLLSFTRGAERISFDGVDWASGARESLTLIGDMRLDWTSDGRLEGVGTTRAAWRGPLRASPTRWERMTPFVQGAIATTVIGLFGALLRLILRRWPDWRELRPLAPPRRDA